jgi:hypothetical protein
MKYSKKNKSGLDWFVFEEVKDSDHIRAAVSFIIKESTRPLYCIEYYSSLFGIVGWFRKEDKYQIQVWEGEDQAKSLSNLNYHYTGEFLSNTGDEEIKLKIIEDSLSFFKDKILRELIEGQMENPKDIMIAREQFLRLG